VAEVTFQDVTKVFPNGNAAVRNVSLSVADGELVVLVGPSGSGKTTTLRLVAGLEEPTSGSIRINGRVVNHLPPRTRDVAMVFQKHNLYPHLDVRANLAFGARLRRPSRWMPNGQDGRQWEESLNGRVVETGRLLGLEGLMDRYPRQLSGGEQQRTALGRAIVRQPAVYLLDEPLSQLDAPLRAELRYQLHLLHRRLRATILYVTHDQMEAMTLGDRVVVMDHGVVQQADHPTQVYEWPNNRFVAGFIGWPPMNFIDGRLRWADGQWTFTADGWSLPVPAERVGRDPAMSEWPATLGMRPEHLAVGIPEAAGAVAMEVVLVEPLGSDTLVTLQRGERRIIARMNKRVPDFEGPLAGVVFDMQQSHWFDSQSGQALAAGVPSG
jgi:multiple sugar transport system ATP-binding protein